MPARSILLLGDQRRLTPCRKRKPPEELPRARVVGEGLRDTLVRFRQKHGIGRAIAAPQIGELVRLIYRHIPEPELLLDPRLESLSAETFELWDDCMSFPELLVRVRRHRSRHLLYRDLGWKEREVPLEEDLSELLQHECDHLDGVLAVGRVCGPDAFALRRQLT